MNQVARAPSNPTFADFMYAVVVGVAFSYVKFTDPLGILVPTFFLLFVVLEDFFLYQTEVKPRTDIFTFTSGSSLIFEVGILLAWFLAFLSRSDAIRWSFAFFAVFFFAKWLASAKHTGLPGSKQWVVNRDYLFWISVIVSLVLVFVPFPSVTPIAHQAISVGWLILIGFWILQTILWWTVVRQYERRHGGA